MKILLSGTPGTGKTSIAKRLGDSLKLKYISLNDFAERNNLVESVDKKRDCMIIDEKRLAVEVEKIKEDCILDGHLAHFCKGNLTIVLRTNPEELKARLKKRGWSSEKISENIEAEILDSCLIESSMPEKTIEFDTTTKSIEESAKELEKIIRTGSYDNYKPGRVDWSSYIERFMKKDTNI